MAEEAKDTKPETKPETTYTEEQYKALEAKVQSLTDQLAEANKTIKSYTDMDIDAIKKSAADWQQKAEQAEAERAAFEHRTKLAAYVKGLGLRDDVYEAHVTALLEEKGLKFDGDKLIGGEDVVQTFRETHADAFAPDRSEQVAAPTSGNAPKMMSGVEKAFFAKNPGLVPKT